MDFLCEWAFAERKTYARESGLGFVGAMDEERATTGRPYYDVKTKNILS